MKIAIAKITLPQRDLRDNIDQEALHELADSLREQGQLQAISVRATEGDRYEIVFGARRYRAAKLLGWTDINAELADNTDEHRTAAHKLIENVQRQDLTPVEEAYGLVDLIGDEQPDIYRLQRATGKSREWIKTRLAILALPDDTQGALQSGAVSMAVALALGTIENDVLRVQYLQHAEAEGMTGEEARRWAAAAPYAEAGILPPDPTADPTNPEAQNLGVREHRYNCFVCRSVANWRQVNPMIICGDCQDAINHSHDKPQHIDADQLREPQDIAVG
jgi:ParB family chromosome partitioning protein